MAQLVDDQRPRRRTRLFGFLIILFMVAIVAGPLLYVYLPRETARWQLAAAIEQRLDGDLEAAIESLTRALEKFPDNEELYRQRAEWRRENRQYEPALEDANRAVSLAPQDIAAYLVRSQIYQHLQRHKEAIEDWNQIIELGREWGTFDIPSALNGRSYARAVGRIELQEALEDIEQALQSAGQDAAMLDTRGFIYYQRGEFTAARDDMEQAVELIEAEHRLRTKLLQEGRLGIPDPRQFDLELKRHAQAVAVIRYHRALVYDQLGLPDRAEEDRRRVRELGFEPDQDLF